MSNCALRRTIALSSVAILMLVEFSMFSDFLYPFRYFWNHEKVLDFSLSLALFFWSLSGVFLMFFSGRSLIRTLTLPLFLACFLFNILYFEAASAPLDFQQSDVIVRNVRWFFREAVENYGLAFLPLLLVFIPLVLVAEWLPKLSKVDLPKTLYFVPMSAVILTFLGLQHSDGFFDRYPSFFRVPTMLAFAGLSSVYDGARSDVEYSGYIDPAVEKIVLVVDESIRADILGINGYEEDTTPFLRSLETGIVNFGLAASSSNCSDYSNLIIRTGVRKEAIPDRDQMSLKTPSIWQFADKAGYYNVYLDAQSPEGSTTYQNFINQHEAAFIDEVVRVRQEIAYNSDRVALEKLVDYLSRPGKTFIILNKYGMHFPYFRSYPKEHDYFGPVLRPGEPMYDRERSLNSFMNGIRWSVDEWFQALLSESANLEPYVIIYTSDHGQNIVDDGTLATHCRPRATRFEGIVPMVVFSNDAAILPRFEAVQVASFNETSHFQVFPTLIELAGYDDSWARSHYGASLSDPPGTSPEFFVGDVHGRGSVRKWVSISSTETGGD